MAGLTSKTAWRASAIEALGTRVRPAFKVFTPPVTINSAGLYRTALSAPITGTAAPRALVVLSVGGSLIRGVADDSGSWSVTAPVADVGNWPISVWQVTDRGIHAPATAKLLVRPSGTMPSFDDDFFETTSSPVIISGDGVPGGEVEIEIGDLSPWLLDGGAWNDDGVWDDDAVWED